MILIKLMGSFFDAFEFTIEKSFVIITIANVGK